jgi:Na+-driven multidrug efflux pump
MITVTAIIQSHGFTKYTMFVALGINVIHIVGNYLFIYGALGIPKLGVVGVAVSTVISICIGLFINLLVLTKKVKVTLNWRNLFSWKQDHVKKILKIDIPASASNLSYSANQIVTTAFIVSLGAEMLSKYHVFYYGPCNFNGKRRTDYHWAFSWCRGEGRSL